ncbi:unnamed protein product, partial [Polarella glacialis]
PGYHRILLEYFEKAQAASIRLSYSGPDTDNQLTVIPSSVLWGAAGTLKPGTNAKFFAFAQNCLSFPSLSDRIPDFQRFDDNVDYASSVSAWTGLSFSDNFAASWAGFVVITSPGLYTFQVVADDGARLFVNSALILSTSLCQ